MHIACCAPASPRLHVDTLATSAFVDASGPSTNERASLDHISSTLSLLAYINLKHLMSEWSTRRLFSTDHLSLVALLVSAISRRAVLAPAWICVLVQLLASFERWMKRGHTSSRTSFLDLVPVFLLLRVGILGSFWRSVVKVR